MAINATELSCQGLAAVQLDADGPTFYGEPVVGYAAEMRRRGEWHVYGCDLIGHGIADIDDDDCPDCRHLPTGG